MPVSKKYGLTEKINNYDSAVSFRTEAQNNSINKNTFKKTLSVIMPAIQSYIDAQKKEQEKISLLKKQNATTPYFPNQEHYNLSTGGKIALLQHKRYNPVYF